MTLSEFKAWLEGFDEAIGDAPTPEQWARIKAKLADVKQAAASVSPIPRYEYRPNWIEPPLIARGATGQALPNRGEATCVNERRYEPEAFGKFDLDRSHAADAQAYIGLNDV